MPAEREIEAALLIYSDDPVAVAEGIAGLTEIAGYRLVPRSIGSLHDRYFDTPDRALQARRLPLRVRESGGDRWLTFKAPIGACGSSAHERREIELPWSRDALGRIARELEQWGIKLPTLRPGDDSGDPAAAMTRLGLELVQDRENHRQVRDVLPAGPAAGRLAELALDRVDYHFSKRTVRLHGIEVEAKDDEGVSAVAVVASALLAAYQPALRAWPYGKLATGREIGGLLAAGALDELIGAEGTLQPAAFDQLDELLCE